MQDPHTRLRKRSLCRGGRVEAWQRHEAAAPPGLGGMGTRAWGIQRDGRGDGLWAGWVRRWCNPQAPCSLCLKYCESGTCGTVHTTGDSPFAGVPSAIFVLREQRKQVAHCTQRSGPCQGCQ